MDGLSTADRARVERFNKFQHDGLGYLHMQSTRPQTLVYALNDSPAGKLAWIVEKFLSGPTRRRTAMEAPDLLAGDVRALVCRWR